MTSHEEDAGAPAPVEAPRLAVLPLVPLGEDDAGLCVDGLCRLPE